MCVSVVDEGDFSETVGDGGREESSVQSEREGGEKNRVRNKGRVCLW